MICSDLKLEAIVSIIFRRKSRDLTSARSPPDILRVLRQPAPVLLREGGQIHTHLRLHLTYTSKWLRQLLMRGQSDNAN